MSDRLKRVFTDAYQMLTGAAIGFALTASYGTMPILTPPSRLVDVHDSVRIEMQHGSWHPLVRPMDRDLADRVVGIVKEELDKYPPGFVSDVCGVNRIVVLETALPSLGGLYVGFARRIEVYTHSDGQLSEGSVRATIVHEVDHACNHQNRTREDVGSWASLVHDPPSLLESFVQNHIAPRFEGVDRLPPPPGFAHWYAVSTARSLIPYRRHKEDEASVKQLITYGRGVLRERSDPLLDAKAALLVDRYVRWSGGVMDDAYFKSWSTR